MQECFQEYIRQRASMVDLNDHHAKTLGAVEAGEEKDDDDAVVCAGLDDFAGIVVAPCGDGPPTTSATAWVSCQRALHNGTGHCTVLLYYQNYGVFSRCVLRYDETSDPAGMTTLCCRWNVVSSAPQRTPTS